MENNSTITLRQTLFPNPQRGRCICFRTVSYQQGRSISSSLHQIVISFYSIPFDFFGDGGGDDDVNSSNPHVEVLMPFCTSTDLSKSSTLSSIGSSLFVVGGERFRTDLGFYRFDTAAPADGWSAMPMFATRAMPLTLVMDGKLYVFGGNPYAPLAELFDPSLTPSRFLPLHPPPSFLNNCNWLHLVIAAFQRSKKILVASADVAIVYNVVDRVWEELDHKADFSRVRGQAAVFRNGTALCWCSRDAEEVHAYDLVLKRWFESPIKGLDKIAYREPDLPFLNCPLLPLDDNHLCLIWQDRICYADTDLPLFHCSKIRVSIYTDAQGESRFDAVVVASRSALLGEGESILLDAHVFLREEDEGGERGSGSVGHDRGTWERYGYGGGRRIASSIAPFKRYDQSVFLPRHMERDCKGVSKCLSPGHMERDYCKGVFCFKCGVIGHTVRDCNMVGGGGGGGRGRGGWNVSGGAS